MKKLLLPLLILLAYTSEAQFQFTPFYLDADTNSGYLPDYGHTKPYNFAVADDKLFFTASTEAMGSELWVTDGTQSGTHITKDVWPGKVSARLSWEGAILNNRYYFTAHDSAYSDEIWVSDGTQAGTYLVKDIILNNPSSPSSYVPLNNKILFCANTYKAPLTCCRELYSTDGTSSGTSVVKQIYGGYGYYGSLPSKLTLLNNIGYFYANDSFHGRELWRTDGTAAGTQLVKDITPGIMSTSFSGFKSALGKVYFGIHDTSKTELWVTDGTAAGTQSIKILEQKPYPDLPVFIAENKGYIYFTLRQYLWITDGTSQGTKIVTDKNGQQVALTSPAAQTKVIYNNKLYFANSSRIYVTDGTAVGTYVAVDLNLKQIFNSINYMTVYSDYFFFKAEDTNGHAYLWCTDGTAANTRIVQPPGSNRNDPLHYNLGMAVFDSVLYFAAAFDNNATELWSLRDTVKYPIHGVGVTEPMQVVNDLEVYPNPSDGHFTVKVDKGLKGDCQLTVYDITGKVIDSYPVRETIELNLSGCAPGGYILHLTSGKNTATRKILVE
ncbi:MAG: T9SS type A sorting domain-containing protein [Chitinophagales bacterium]|nr:T9SS type A sorting domain-containing protein [Chitinophagales bacterium]